MISQINEDPNSVWLRWKTLFSDLLNKHAPVSTIRIKGNSAPYLTKEIKSMMYQRDYLKSKAYKPGSKYLRQAYQHLHNKVCYSTKNLNIDYNTKKIQEASGNIKNTWKVLKKLTDKASKEGNIQKLVIDGAKITDPSVITEKLNKYFSTVGSKLSKKIPDTEMLTTQSINRCNAKF